MSQEPDELPQPLLSPQDERLARLRELRRQRQQFGTGPLDPQRRGLPTPPPSQPPVQELIKHWWHHGPFSGRLPSVSPPDPQTGKRETRPGPPPALPPTATPYEERAKEWIAQGRKGLSMAGARAQEMMHQARDLLNQKMQSQSKPADPEDIVPGMIIIGFAPNVSMEDAVREIGALGGKPLRHKAALNLYQIAVPPGQEQASIELFRQRPGVISADLERSPPRDEPI